MIADKPELRNSVLTVLLTGGSVYVGRPEDNAPVEMAREVKDLIVGMLDPWQPIETAPEDVEGPWILIWGGKGAGPAVVPTGPYLRAGRTGATLWQPITPPEPPK